MRPLALILAAALGLAACGAADPPTAPGARIDLTRLWAGR